MANTKSNLNIRIDANIKETATPLLASMGLYHTTVVEMLYRQIIRERRLPFQPTADEPNYAQQLHDIIKRKNIPHKTVEVNAEGHIIVDKDKDPELYDWAVNG
jgi:addiction module RelB/DinJ family antitoxin